MDGSRTWLVEVSLMLNCDDVAEVFVELTAEAGREM